jgi:hypothetical protein
LLHDALGSLLGGINSGDSFNFQYTYDPFGNFSASGAPPSGYSDMYVLAGMEFDPTGLYHAGARY